MVDRSDARSRLSFLAKVLEGAVSLRDVLRSKKIFRGKEDAPVRAKGGYDYIVVGAGPAGCVVAGRLSRQGASVLLLEAGGKPWHPLLSVPLAAWLAMSDPRFHRAYQTEQVDALGGRRLGLLAGRVVGGGAAINGMLFLRGGRHDFDRWRDEAGCEGWGFDDVLPWFRRFEQSARGGDEWHGGDGPVRTSRAPHTLELAQRFLDAASDCGLPLVDDLNAAEGEAAGWFDAMSGGGVRSLPGAAYLRREHHRGRLTLISGASVTRIVIAGGTARGVTYLVDGKEVTASAGGEVILAAGAIQTPHLMQLSGFGPADQLAAAGIRPLVDLPQVGANLQNHLAYSVDYACDRDLTFARYLDPVDGSLAALRYAFGRGGALAGTPCPAGALIRAGDDSVGPDSQIILGGGMPPASGHSGFRLMVNHGRPHSRGRVFLREADPLAAPGVDAGWNDPRDLALLRRAVERTRAIAAAPALAGVVSHELAPGPQVAAPADLDAALRAGAFSYYHSVGTCRMGADGDAVVDLRLRVRGVERLRIADNSVAPLQINANTAACALMIGERAAAFITGESGAVAA